VQGIGLGGWSSGEWFDAVIGELIVVGDERRLYVLAVVPRFQGQK
jgi:hypothetical protein